MLVFNLVVSNTHREICNMYSSIVYLWKKLNYVIVFYVIFKLRKSLWNMHVEFKASMLEMGVRAQLNPWGNGSAGNTVFAALGRYLCSAISSRKMNSLGPYFLIYRRCPLSGCPSAPRKTLFPSGTRESCLQIARSTRQQFTLRPFPLTDFFTRTALLKNLQRSTSTHL